MDDYRSNHYQEKFVYKQSAFSIKEIGFCLSMILIQLMFMTLNYFIFDYQPDCYESFSINPCFKYFVREDKIDDFYICRCR